MASTQADPVDSASGDAEPFEKAAPSLQAPQTPAFERWSKPASLTRRGWLVLGAVLLVVQFPLIHRFLLRGPQPAPLSIPQEGYRQDFSDAGVVDRDFWSTGGDWRVVGGELLSPGVKNNPLWLQARLPRDAVIEFDVRSESPEGDIKVELFGDGLNHQSGYVLIHGGWKNRLSIIARLDEHGIPLDDLKRAVAAGRAAFGPDSRLRAEAHPFPVTTGRTYRWRLERKGSLLRWYIDDAPFMELDDPYPLEGPGHDRFGFSSWEAQLYFDNLSVRPL